MRLPAIRLGSVNDLRYQPSPPGKNPVALVWSDRGSWVMLQSWGTVRRCQLESSKPAAAAFGSAEFPYVPEGSVVLLVLTSLNLQPRSKLTVREPWLRTPRLGSPEPEVHPIGPRSLGVVAPWAAADSAIVATIAISAGPALRTNLIAMASASLSLPL